MGPATETDKSMPAAGVAGERAASARKKEKGRNYLLAPHLVGLCYPLPPLPVACGGQHFSLAFY